MLLMTTGVLLVLFGILSFLIPAITNVVTFLFLIVGAVVTVIGTWFLK